MSSCDRFNATLLALLEELYRITEKKLFSKYHIFVESNADEDDSKHKFIEAFIIHAIEHRDRIRRKDIEFFLAVPLKDDQPFHHEIETLRDMFKDLTTSNQLVVFDYVIIMLGHAEAYTMDKLRLNEA